MSAMPAAIADSVSALPDLLQEPVQRWFEQQLVAHGELEVPDEVLPRLARLVACSEFAATVLQRDWQWFVAAPAGLDARPDTAALEELVAELGVSDDGDAAKAFIRRFRHRWMVQVLWRELGGTASLDETLRDLSMLADRMLDGAARCATNVVEKRFGRVLDGDGRPVPLVMLGMGKLGGDELNFSSDVDLVFLYPGGSQSDGRKCIGAQDYFARVSHQIVALVDELTAEGFAFRVDTRLRPFGDSGPPVTSFSAFETYLVQHGRSWERYAYVKARIVGPQPRADIATELQDDLIGPFVYRRYLDFGVFESLREMHAMISAEVVRREMANNVKLGPGGIREIEFIVQSLQLVRGGSRPELQEHSLLRVLPRLVGRHGLAEGTDVALAEAYRYLRRLENFIQAIRDRQTHDLPANDADRARLCLAMGHDDWNELLVELNRHRDRVTREFESLAFRGQEGDSSLQRHTTELWKAGAAAEAWTALLVREKFVQPDALGARIADFAGAAATRQVDAVAARRLQAFVPLLLDALRGVSNADLALERVLALVTQILRRSAYLALLNENPGVLSRLVALCEQSSFIADQIARYPVLLDELLDPSVHASPLLLDELESELRARIAECRPGDSEDEIAALGQFQRANRFRIAVADFAGSLPIMKVSDSLTWLAEAVLKTTLDIAWRDLAEKHGVPGYVVAGEYHEAGFAIVAYGKLGGLEMSYGSDLDLVFLHDSGGSEHHTRGPKVIDNTQFFTRLVRRLSSFLTAQTGSGMLYEVDTRLRPDGQSGVMVSSVEAFERYQVENAWTWEHQALLRARPVAGSARIAAEFERIRGDTLSRRVRRETLQADVIAMRGRMRDKLDRSTSTVFDLKQGAGGIGDIEFIVQYLVLRHAAEDASVYFYTDNIRQLDALVAGGFVAAQVGERLQSVYRDYRERAHHLALDERKTEVPSDAFREQRAWVQKLWHQTFRGL